MFDDEKIDDGANLEPDAITCDEMGGCDERAGDDDSMLIRILADPRVSLSPSVSASSLEADVPGPFCTLAQICSCLPSCDPLEQLQSSLVLLVYVFRASIVMPFRRAIPGPDVR